MFRCEKDVKIENLLKLIPSIKCWTIEKGVIFLKKLFVLLMIPLLITGLFAATSQTTSQTGALSQGMQLTIQTKVLEVMNALDITSEQASTIAKGLTALKDGVNALEKQRIADLTALRDALVSNDATQIKTAKGNIAKLDKEYQKVMTDFIGSIKSTITLEQAGKVLNFARRTMADRGYFNLMDSRPMAQNRKDFANPQNQQNPQNQNMVPQNGMNPVNPQNKRLSNEQKAPANREQRVMPWAQNFRQNPRNFEKMGSFLTFVRSPEFLYNAVNSQLFDLLLNTLELKAK